MSSSSEWELLTIAEDIEQGDHVMVESDDGEDPTSMMFVKCSTKYVLLKDNNGELIKFSTTTLEELEGNRYITGKCDVSV